MSSEPRKLRWWHWLLLAFAVIVILIYVGTYTLQPAAVWAAGWATKAMRVDFES